MSSRIVAGAAIVILLGLSGFLWNSNNQLNKKNKTQNQLILDMEQVQAELNTDYEAALSSIESLRSDNQELNALIDNQKEELKAQKSKINNLIWTQRELDKARLEIAQFETLTAQYLTEINDLKSSNEQLTAANMQLTKNNEVLTEDLATEKQTSEDLRQARAILVSEKDELMANNTALTEKVELGSAIKINWMSLNGGQINDEGEFNRKKRSKKMEVLRTCFRTETNVVVPAGEETFLVRIISPTGETLSSEDAGSGTVTDKLSGEKMRYTMSGTLTYNNEDTEACMDWTPSSELSKGEYTVEIFNKGYKVGSGNFKI